MGKSECCWLLLTENPDDTAHLNLRIVILENITKCFYKNIKTNKTCLWKLELYQINVVSWVAFKFVLSKFFD